MRLINKETLCGILADKALEAQLEDECTELAITECLSIVRQMPTVDAVPVVRCRDCKYYHDFETHYDCIHDYGIDYPMPDDFCSYGERKEGADNG